MTQSASIERSIWIGAAREQVWDAITDPDRLIKWMVPNLPGALMKRDESGKVTVFLGEMGVDFVTVDMTAAARQAVVRGLPDGQIAATYTLDDEKDGTRVTVSMSGFELLAADTREDRLQLSGTGWEQALANLKASVEGAELPHPTAYVGPLFGYWRAPQNQMGIERSIWINGPREKVWRAITDPAQIQQWMSPNTEWQLSALETGGRFFVRDAETGKELYTEVIESVEPPLRIATRTTPEPPDTIVKRKIYVLTDENGGTRLTLSLIGYEQQEVETRWGAMEENGFGFGMMLQNTKAFIEGRDLPFPWGF